MNLSTESLNAFAQAATCGSFSAAARRLGKSQSTISEAVARLELDLGLELFIRGPRQLSLTDAGASLLTRSQALLSAQDALLRHAASLAKGQEVRLSVAVSDAYQPKQYEARLAELDQQFPDLQFETFIAEQADILELVSQGRVQLGLLPAQQQYPGQLAHQRLSMHSQFALYAAHNHPLAQREHISAEDLSQWRLLSLSSVTQANSQQQHLPSSAGKHWFAPDYLLLLEMARLGFGWAELPCSLVEDFAHGQLKALSYSGWPRQVAVDVIWSRQKPLGPAAAWLLERLLGSA